MRKALTTLLALAGLLAAASTAWALLEDESSIYEIRLPEEQFTPIYDMARQEQVAAQSLGWRTFTDDAGRGWKAIFWNEATDLPDFAAGRPIQILEAGFNDEATVAARTGEFLESIRPLLRVDPADLEFVSLHAMGDKAYVHYRQNYQGIPVFTSILTLHFYRGGVNSIAAGIYPGIDIDTSPTLGPEQASEIAHAGMPWNEETDAVEDVQLGVLPIVSDGSVTYTLVYRVHFRTEQPLGDWYAFVDANVGEIYWRYNEIQYYTITGTVHSDVQERRADDPYTNLPLMDQEVYADGHTAHTNDDGEFEVTVTYNQNYTVTDRNRGYYVRVYDAMDGEYSELTTVASPSNPAEFYWDDSNTYPSERDCYYHTNIVHQWVKSVDPTWTDMDFMMLCQVNIDDNCNAYYNGSINFFRAGSGCNNTGQIADVIYHEYHHGVTAKTYAPYSPPTPSGLNEGFSDYCAMTITNSWCMGISFYQYNPDGCLRTGLNDRQYPASECGGEVHCLGEMTMGALWKIRRNLIQKYGEDFTHQVDLYFREAMWGRAQTVPLFFQYFLQANDDNGDLADGTPDYWEIADALDEHNIPYPEITKKIVFDHTPLEDTENTSSPIEVLADITTTGGAGDIVPESTMVFYSYDGINYTAAPMTNIGGDTYRGEIPPSAGVLVDYYLRSVTTENIVGTDPIRAPEKNTYRFLIGAKEAVLDDDLEADLGWTIGAPDDDATAGIWERVDPEGKQYNGEWVQPEDDHTPSGTKCFVTDGRGGFYANYDVDAGKTSVLSPQFDFSSAGAGYIEFYAFLANFGAASDDSLMLFVSNNGTDWTMLWYIAKDGWNDPNYTYHKVYFRPETFGGYSSTVQFKFVVEDNENNTITEAAIDDIAVWITQQSQAAGEEVAHYSFKLAPVSPAAPGGGANIRFELPEAARASLQVYDVGGRLVRTLLDGPVSAGSHMASWDGLTEAGTPAPAGIYYCRLSAADRSTSARLVLVR